MEMRSCKHLYVGVRSSFTHRGSKLESTQMPRNKRPDKDTELYPLPGYTQQEKEQGADTCLDQS